MQNNQPQNVNIKISDEILKGQYANMMMITHTKEEFVLDFMNVLPPQGMVVSRVITSPGHIKRIVAALSENLKKYEDQFGQIVEAPTPSNAEIGFKTQG
ncbi:MAG: DUF3467 domain-containing protein [Candidatus Doudnabacteria bacterium]|nr:DUF3467 domain-containing protein [Candidatus Doudnabacteria bacterium]